MTFGFSRDDAGKFIREYIDKSVFEKDPFQRIDREGVGRLMQTAVELGKRQDRTFSWAFVGNMEGSRIQ